MASAIRTSGLPAFRGELIGVADERYGEARRIWNGAIDRRPALIARCADAADAAAALRAARERNLPLSVRAGGHGVAGHAICEDGLVIDLSPMKEIRVDPQARTARVGAGVLWGELDRATQAHGLATPGGIVTHTGVAGLTLGGGIGWLMHKHGAVVDNLLSCEVVTADGRVVTASADENPDLFWGLRGAGANFGIVTAFEFRLHEVGPNVLAGMILHDVDDASAVVEAHGDLVRSAPRELTTILNFRLAPPLPAVPEELHGRPVLSVAVCWAGDLSAGERVLRPFRAFGRPLLDTVAAKPYAAHQATFDPGVPHGWHYHWRSLELADLTGTVEPLVEHVHAQTSPRSYTIVFHLGGAISEADPESTAFAQRAPGFNVNVNGAWLEDDEEPERHRDWVHSLYERLRAHAGGRVYVNFLADEGQERVRAAYGEERYARLVALKDAWDPDNVFRSNQNIRPSRS